MAVIRMTVNRDSFTSDGRNNLKPPEISGSVTVDFSNELEAKLVLGVVMTTLATGIGWSASEFRKRCGLPADVAAAIIEGRGKDFEAEDLIIALWHIGAVVDSHERLFWMNEGERGGQ